MPLYSSSPSISVPLANGIVQETIYTQRKKQKDKKELVRKKKKKATTDTGVYYLLHVCKS